MKPKARLSAEEIAHHILSLAPDDIDFIVLFGSKARGEKTPLSDTDIGVKTRIPDPSERFRFRLKLIAALNGPSVRVDLVTVEDVTWALRFKIAQDARVLYERDQEAWPAFVEEVLRYCPDFKVFEDRIVNEMLEGFQHGSR